MAEKEDKVTCPVCEHEVGTKEDGTKIKVHKIAGERCDGSESEVQSDVTPAGVDKGQSYEALEASQDDEQATDDSTDPDDENDAQTDAQKRASTGDAGEFVHAVRVRKPAPHIEGDDAWHDANVKVAAKVAARDGYVLVREPKFAGTDETETHFIVRYSAPVK
jgi:hypothetical protein